MFHKAVPIFFPYGSLSTAIQKLLLTKKIFLNKRCFAVMIAICFSSLSELGTVDLNKNSLFLGGFCVKTSNVSVIVGNILFLRNYSLFTKNSEM